MCYVHNTSTAHLQPHLILYKFRVLCEDKNFCSKASSKKILLNLIVCGASLEILTADSGNLSIFRCESWYTSLDTYRKFRNFLRNYFLYFPTWWSTYSSCWLYHTQRANRKPRFVISVQASINYMFKVARIRQFAEAIRKSWSNISHFAWILSYDSLVLDKIFDQYLTLNLLKKIQSHLETRLREYRWSLAVKFLLCLQEDKIHECTVCWLIYGYNYPFIHVFFQTRR